MNNLAKACELSLNDWLATFPETIPEAEHTPKFEKWKKNLFDKMRGNRYHRFTSKTVKIILVAAILSALLLSAFVFPSSREHFVDNFSIFSRYEMTRDNNNSISGEITVGYIPEGYEFSKSINMGKQITNKYVNADGEIFTVVKNASSMKIEFNTENYTTEEFFVEKIKYTYCAGNMDVDYLLWTKNDYIYRLEGPFTLEEFIEIAKTVK